MSSQRITIDPKQMGGAPCVRGLRISVATIVGMLADGSSEEEVLKAYPDLDLEDIRSAVRYAAEALRERQREFSGANLRKFTQPYFCTINARGDYQTFR